MGRSQETFNKKEKERNKLKKRQDKAQKKEERKTSSTKGKGVDEMLAYVDEDGNITATPPDPKKKKQIINQEDIQISISRQAPPDPADLIRKGTLTFFNSAKGYGFIMDHITQERIFVHQSDMTGTINENDHVTFEVEKGLKGLNAVKVQVAP